MESSSAQHVVDRVDADGYGPDVIDWSPGGRVSPARAGAHAIGTAGASEPNTGAT